ncbi:hypothetical protein H696_05542 [Fonticula alba]|uniref:TNFR-Cys domain-containing protein n=1 Tax=Fonticula alba TaxID=691883 RepID=A0A058Z1E1_FONAL|nr:hypothetical protein H696_05542 [Fonticula alba]KCV68065.1 hypothetical protein H696_05542 [Fonticula alba]|eukprot:XP_009497632.1 hypothetical protein H696_05542 [Fonticula alba]
MAPPRVGPLAALLAAVLCLLPAVLGLAPEQDMYLHAARDPVLLLSDPVEMVSPSVQSSTGAVRRSNTILDLHLQMDQVHQLPEVRWGSFFGESFMELHCPRADNPGTWPLMILPVGEAAAPTAVEYTQSTVALFGETMVFDLPASDSLLLAGTAFSTSQVDLLGLYGPADAPRDAFMGTITPDGFGWQLLELAPVSGVAIGQPGIGRAFYLANGHHLMCIMTSDSRVTETSTALMPGAILAMAATQLAVPGGSCPGLRADVLVLLDSGQLQIHLCLGLEGPVGVVYGALPAGVSAAGAWFLTPAAPSTAGAPAPLYLVLPSAADARDRLWLAHIREVGLAWQRVVLPPVVTRLSDLRLARLRMEDHRSGRWTLLHGQTALFESSSFGCDSDRSITCDGGLVSSGSASGWACAEGHAEAPYVSPGKLCAGCMDGWFLDRPADEVPLSEPSHVCRPCASAHCRTCDARDCLVCEETHFPEPSGPAGATVCVAVCSRGFALVAGACQPAGMPLAVARLTVPEADPVPGLAPGDSVTAAGETWLQVDPGTGLPVVPAAAADAGPAAGMLLFTEQQKVLFLPASAVGQAGGAPPAREVVLLDVNLPGPVVAFAETRSFSEDNQLLLMLALCLRPGTTFVVILACPAGPGGTACVIARPASASLLSADGCLAVRRVDSGSLFVQKTRTWGLLLRPDVTQQRVSAAVLEGHGLVGLPVRSGDRARLDPGPGEWFLSVNSLGLPGAAPQFLPWSWDSRLLSLSGRLLRRQAAAALAVDGPCVPVFLPRGPGGAPPELVFPLGAGSDWTVLRVPGDMLPSGRSVDLPFSWHVLGALPRELPPSRGSSSDVLFQGVALPAGGARFPSALVLLARHFIGVSLLFCADGAAGPCVLRPAVFVDLPAGMHSTADAGLWTLAVAGGPGPGPGPVGTLQSPGEVTLVAFAPDVGMLVFALAMECPGGGDAPLCAPCHEACATCDAPGPDGCMSCRHWAWTSPGECLAACPGGLFAEPDGRCVCHPTCAQCAQAGASGYTCTRCVGGHAVDPHAGSPGRCFECAASCGECSRPGDPAACTACLTGDWLLDGTCVGCLTRAAPWPGMNIGEIMAAVLGGSRPVISPLAGSAADLVQAGWQEDPGRRPSTAAFRQRCAALFVASGGLAGP